MNKNHKIKVGSKYRNMHTMKMCTVTSKWFYMVEYRDDDGIHGSIHYKTFKKNWVEMVKRADLRFGCRTCGLDCTSNGGAQWLSHSCSKQYKAEKKPVDLIEVCRNE